MNPNEPEPEHGLASTAIGVFPWAAPAKDAHTTATHGYGADLAAEAAQAALRALRHGDQTRCSGLTQGWTLCQNRMSARRPRVWRWCGTCVGHREPVLRELRFAATTGDKPRFAAAFGHPDEWVRQRWAQYVPVEWLTDEQAQAVADDSRAVIEAFMYGHCAAADMPRVILEAAVMSCDRYLMGTSADTASIAAHPDLAAAAAMTLTRVADRRRLRGHEHDRHTPAACSPLSPADAASIVSDACDDIAGQAAFGDLIDGLGYLDWETYRSQAEWERRAPKLMSAAAEAVREALAPGSPHLGTPRSVAWVMAGGRLVDAANSALTELGGGSGPHFGRVHRFMTDRAAPATATAAASMAHDAVRVLAAVLNAAKAVAPGTAARLLRVRWSAAGKLAVAASMHRCDDPAEHEQASAALRSAASEIAVVLAELCGRQEIGASKAATRAAESVLCSAGCGDTDRARCVTAFAAAASLSKSRFPAQKRRQAERHFLEAVASAPAAGMLTGAALMKGRGTIAKWVAVKEDRHRSDENRLLADKDLMRAASLRSPGILHQVAMSPHASAETLSRLAASDRPTTRKLVPEASAAPSAALLTLLAMDSDPDVAHAAITRLAAVRDSSTPAENRQA